MFQITHLKGYGARCRLVNLLSIFVLVLVLGFSARAEPTYKVLALGDSLTAGYGMAQPDAFPRQLEAYLRAQGHDIEVVNGGVSGDTSSGGRARLDWLVDGSVDLVIIELGANDGLRGIEPSVTRENLDWILQRLKDKKVGILLTGMMAPPNLGADYGAEFKALYGDLALKHNVMFDAFFLEGVAAAPALNQDDGIHPNAQGVAVIVKRLAPKVMQLFGQKKPAP
ncbi:MAG: arylesterase [Rhodospirillaceae bacterium]|nr:MAG: arylesterase [Rhodospirillaceae bacterium]